MRATVHLRFAGIGGIDAHHAALGARERKNVADDPTAFHPGEQVRLAPATNGRDSMTDSCMLRTTYQRGADVEKQLSPPDHQDVEGVIMDVRFRGPEILQLRAALDEGNAKC
jgi:hypothetical protein